MKHVLLILFFLTPHFLQASAQFQWSEDKELHNKVSFIKHEEESKPFGAYLIMNINYSPVKKLFSVLDKSLGNGLDKKNARTEAHITVVTPPEYDQTLKGLVTIQEIHQLAESMKIQEFTFTPVCIGKAQFKKMSTYYLVVYSRKLLVLRKKIYDLFKKRGGNTSLFDPNLFYPHITIGYTDKDLHMGPHGVKKGINSCWGRVLK